jgi:hypothetical protein
MRRKRKIEITTFTEQILVLRPAESAVSAWCEQCSEQVSMVTTDQAAAIARVYARTVSSWIERGKLHFTETHDGRLLVCLNSLRMSGSSG